MRSSQAPSTQSEGSICDSVSQDFSLLLSNGIDYFNGYSQHFPHANNSEQYYVISGGRS